MTKCNSLHPADKEIAIKFNSVCFSYGDVCVLDKASFHIHRGEFVAMVGPNGCGKTTVLKLLLGLEEPSGGTIELFGNSRSAACRKLRQAGKHSPKANIAYVPQQAPPDKMFPITVYDIVRMGLLQSFDRYGAYENDSVNKAMEQCGIAGLADRPYRALSGGQRRRALVARALASRPDFLVLDEPTANMDAGSETRLYETLGAYKDEITILIVTHDTEFVTPLTDRVLCLTDGTIVQHRIESAAGIHHGGSGQGARVLHGENIPADDCCLPAECKR